LVATSPTPGPFCQSLDNLENLCLDVRWKEKELSALRVEGLLKFREVVAIASTWDGIKGGNPKREYECMVVANLVVPGNIVLPPMEILVSPVSQGGGVAANVVSSRNVWSSYIAPHGRPCHARNTI
jgi:hypothetical protein